MQAERPVRTYAPAVRHAFHAHTTEVALCGSGQSTRWSLFHAHAVMVLQMVCVCVHWLVVGKIRTRWASEHRVLSAEPLSKAADVLTCVALGQACSRNRTMERGGALAEHIQRQVAILASARRRRPQHASSQSACGSARSSS